MHIFRLENCSYYFLVVDLIRILVRNKPFWSNGGRSGMNTSERGAINLNTDAKNSTTYIGNNRSIGCLHGLYVIVC